MLGRAASRARSPSCFAASLSSPANSALSQLVSASSLALPRQQLWHHQGATNFGKSTDRSRSIIGVVQSLAKAAVTQAIDKAILKAGSALATGAGGNIPSITSSSSVVRPTHVSPSSVAYAPSASGMRSSEISGGRYGNLSGGGSGDYSADMKTWRALVDHPVVTNADFVDTKDLYLVSNDM